MHVTDNEIVLTSPNGKNKITLRVDDSIAGIWLTSKDHKESVAIFLNHQGAAVGVYGANGPGNQFSGVCASGPEGGSLQLSKVGQVKQFGQGDLSRESVEAT